MRITYDINKFLDIERNLTQKQTSDKKQVTTPDLETFDEILKKAQKGNEMATVQIIEWAKNCQPANLSEKQILDKASMALKKLFNE